jgi:hypothetical protein
MIGKLVTWWEVLKEALRRDEEEAGRLDAENPDWRRDTFDGPGSLQSLGHHLEVVARERGLGDDVEALKAWAKARRGGVTF